MNKILKICLIVLLFNSVVNSQDNNPEDNNPEDNNPEYNKPEDNKPEDNKPEDNNPEDNKPEDNKPEDNIPSGITSEPKKVQSSFFDSITSLKDNIKSFFNVTQKKFKELKTRIQGLHSKMQVKGRKIKKALQRFIAEVFFNITFNCEPVKFSMNNKEAKLSTPDLIVTHGYRSETHTIISSDGYMSTVHRILPKNLNNTRIKRKVAILQHGLLGSSLDWILLGPKRALPYLLSDAEFDVWLPNARGNIYSKFNVDKPIESEEFWDFSWHEIGIYDISAIIDYIKDSVSSDSKIFYIAYSMSATALLVLLSTLPQYNAILTSVVLLAPLVYLRDVQGPLKYLAERYDQRFTGLGHLEFKSFSVEDILEEDVLNRFCKGPKLLCENPLLLLGDGGKHHNDFNITAYILNNVPSGGSKKTIVHYLQVIGSEQFQMFDFGIVDNFKKYGQQFPPIYNLGNIGKPLILFNSLHDWLSTAPDIDYLLEQLSDKVVHHLIKSRSFSHLDFMWSKDAVHLVYLPLIDELINA